MNNQNTPGQNPQNQISHLKPVHHRYWIPIIIIIALVAGYFMVAGVYEWSPYQDKTNENQIIIQDKDTKTNENGIDTSINRDVKNQTVTYDGLGKNIAPEYAEYLAFKNCNNEISHCDIYLVPNEDVKNQTLTIDSQYKITGDIKDGGVAAGTTYNIMKPGTVVTFDELSAMSDWQTYRNKEYGFEFKYPKYLKQTEHSSNWLLFAESESDFFNIKGPTAYSLDGYVYANQPDGLSYTFNRKTDSWDANDNYPGSVDVSPSRKYINKNGIAAYIAILKDGPGEGEIAIIEIPSKGVFEIFIGRNNSITDCAECDKSEYPKSVLQETINQILSTFKFIE